METVYISYENKFLKRNDLYALNNDDDYVQGIKERHSQSHVKRKELVIKNIDISSFHCIVCMCLCTCVYTYVLKTKWNIPFY